MAAIDFEQMIPAGENDTVRFPAKPLFSLPWFWTSEKVTSWVPSTHPGEREKNKWDDHHAQTDGTNEFPGKFCSIHVSMIGLN